MVYSLLFLVGEIHAEENEGGTKEEPDGNLLMEQPPGEDDRGDGIEVDPVRGDNSAEFADDPVPHDVTEHRSDDTQEEQVPEHLWTKQQVHRG